MEIGASATSALTSTHHGIHNVVSLTPTKKAPKPVLRKRGKLISRLRCELLIIQKNPKVRSPTELIMDPFEEGGVLRVRVV